MRPQIDPDRPPQKVSRLELVDALGDLQTNASKTVWVSFEADYGSYIIWGSDHGLPGKIDVDVDIFLVWGDRDFEIGQVHYSKRSAGDEPHRFMSYRPVDPLRSYAVKTSRATLISPGWPEELPPQGRQYDTLAEAVRSIIELQEHYLAETEKAGGFRLKSEYDQSNE